MLEGEARVEQAARYAVTAGESERRMSRFPGGQGLDTSPVADSIKVITAIVRGDRFSEGTVLAALNDGTLLAAIRRLTPWNEAGRPAQ